ncbi:MAG: hypothetical protein LLG04_01725 [Parachlamydia sp.]|nr:hypothetical protein [Parachlamydia sp.]
MTSTISRWFGGIASTFMPKQVTPPLTQPQLKVAAQAQVIGSTSQVSNSSAQPPRAESLSDNGWFAPVTGFFRDKFYSCIKGKKSDHSQDVRKAYFGIGAEEVFLKASEKLDVRAFSIKSENFHKKILEVGGKFVDLVDRASNVRFPAIEMPKGLPKDKDFQEYLKDMGILGSKYGDGQWESFESEGKTYIVTVADYAEVSTTKYKNQVTGNLNPHKIEVRDRCNEVCQAKSTVILSGAIYSHFESYNTAREVSAFLIRGLDVVIFEDKNKTVWDSESVTHTGAARDAIYKHVLEQPGIKAENVIWKGTCFGAVPNVVAAAKYSRSAVIADQSFVRFSDIASGYAGQTKWGKWIPSFLRAPFIEAAASANDCAHTLEHALPKVQGPVCLIENDRDELIPGYIRQGLSKLLPANKQNCVVHINNESIKHADGWYKDAKASQQIDQFLKQIGATQGSFLNQRVAAPAA